ncbi:MAG TPA: ABC transporter permease [Actinomycetota bacterium]|nr:ABC transporter permease [Actinomycetota bacterium]
MTGFDGVRLVARRELVERTRDRSFLISTLVTLAILCAVIVVPKLLGAGKTPTYDVGLIGTGSRPLAQALTALAPQERVKVRLRQPADLATAEAQLRGGRLDVAVVDGRQLVSKGELDAKLGVLVQAVSRVTRAQAVLAEAQLSQGQIQAALSPAPLPVRALQPSSPENQARKAIAFTAVFLLYGQIIGYGIAVASGVVEEKATRIVEVLLAAVRPVQLLAGKILGIGLVGLVQLFIVGGVGLAVATGTKRITLPPGATGTIALILVWFVLGYAFYSCLFAAAGAIVSRQEELQNTVTPLNLVLLASFFLAFSASSNPDGTLAKVTSFLPPVAPLVMPPRVAGGEVAGWEVALSVLAMLTAIAVLVPLAARIYSGAVLRTGARVKLGTAWVGGRR